MKKNTLLLTTLSFILSPALSFAFFCPTNFSQIEEGNTIDQVKQICGKPDKEETKDAKPEEGPQEWNYYIPQTVSTTAMTSVQGTLKTQITFDKDGKAVNISVNGIGVGSSTICGKTIQLGENRNDVKAACGEPTFINKQQPSAAAQQQPNKITTLFYNVNPPMKLIFENGILKGKE